MRSGPFSCTRSAPETAAARSVVKDRRPHDDGDGAPRRCSAGVARCTYSRSRSSAPGATSVAVTSRPWARKRAVQLAPITPVPITATRLIELFMGMLLGEDESDEGTEAGD